MGCAVVLACLSFLLLCALLPATDALGFTCTAQPEATCQALVGYISPNTTTLKSIQSLFGVKHLRSLLAANNLSPTTLPTATVQATDTVIIPFTCRCSNGSGISDRSPVYTVQKDDGLYYIAAAVFSYLVVYQDIQLVNRIENASLIYIGQELWIPLPCSCDQVDGEKTVHYAHVVAEGSTVEEIATEFGVLEQTLLDLNGLASPNALMAYQAFDVPLKACTSKIRNDSLDASLLVPGGTYALTANNCVKCSCNSAYNWTLQCHPLEIALSSDSSCPPMQCSDALSIGNTTTTSCNSTACSYAGYTSQNAILTDLETKSTCPAPPPSPGLSPNGNGNNHAAKTDIGMFGWNFLVTAMSILLSVQRI
ncbi:lysM domain-containing GPI-anchored protein 2-like [Syzygium oleosum]|uniref:lysM domain-containing GPI-anchored protein 2-like n=1 Tax=Syzygium oleosum TaxID=219896 RepID=UPI0024BA0447|nr:lysM domain-containing GPI-anchored protein 2-like [Syzygium oleosum]